MKYTDYVAQMVLAVQLAARQARHGGITIMSLDNLRQITRFPAGAANPNMAARAFADAVEQLRGKLGIKVLEP